MQALRIEREKNGMTQEELAEKINVVRQTISHYETGKRTPPVYMAKRIAKVLHCEWSELYNE